MLISPKINLKKYYTKFQIDMTFILITIFKTLHFVEFNFFFKFKIFSFDEFEGKEMLMKMFIIHLI